MVFGIDLGTTNSLIGTNGSLLSGLVSSNVDIRRRCEVPRDVITDDIVASYKTDMSIGESGKLAVTCSTVILKELAKRVHDEHGFDVKDVVISVPAYFSTSQREAVYKAADEAGLNVMCLINEPTAAAIYLCQDYEDLIVVYDLGGGTFDVSIVDSRLGRYTVIATDGLTIGGDNLDKALVDLMIKKKKIPLRLRGEKTKAKMKLVLRLAKEEIQVTRSDVKVDMSEFGIDDTFILTVEDYKQVVYDTFSDTFDTTAYLIDKYIPVSDVRKPKLILVGGSTNCPYLKDIIVNELDVDVVQDSLKPDYVVAKGVSIYAGMVESGEAETNVDDVTKRLCIEDASGKTITIIESNSIIPCTNSIVVSNSTTSNKLSLKMYQGDALMAEKNYYIGTLEYNFNRVVEKDAGIVEVIVSVSRDGIVSLKACEVLYGDSSMQEIELKIR